MWRVISAGKLSAVVFILASCVNSTYKAFYKGEGKTLYFVYPLKFKSEENNLEAYMDYTLEDQNDSIVVNTSVISRDLMEIIALEFESGDNHFKLNDLKKILTDKQGKNFSLRYSGKMAVEDFKEWLSEENLKVTLNTRYVFRPTSKSKKELQAVNEEILIFR